MLACIAYIASFSNPESQYVMTIFVNVYDIKFAPATIDPMTNANVKRNPNPNPNLNHTLNPYPTLNQKPNHNPNSNSLFSEISL